MLHANSMTEFSAELRLCEANDSIVMVGDQSMHLLINYITEPGGKNYH